MTDRLLLLSGCRWNDTGGAQRPPQLARALARLGHEVAYWPGDARVKDTGGVTLLIEKHNIPEWAGAGKRGWVLLHYPTLWPLASDLVHDGWRLCYDCLDDWAAFVDQGFLRAQDVRHEREVWQKAERVCCTTQALVDLAAQEGRGDAVLIPNAGPEAPIPRQDPTATAIFSGYLFGPWLDWSALDALERAGVDVEIIGKHGNPPGFRHLRFVGEKPWTAALERMAGAQVGIIPFKGPGVCTAVDPVKWYDYAAAGLWTVATPVMRELEGRPWTILAEPQDFPDAVREAAARQKTDRPTAEHVRANSWGRRAERLLGLLHSPQVMVVAPREVPIPLASMPEEKCKLRVTWQAPIRCNMHPPCPYCNNHGTRATLPQDMPGTAEEWFRGFARLADFGPGPLYLSVCFGEPLADPLVLEVVARLARFTRIDLVTNLVAPMRVLNGIPRNGNVALCTSFHPHAWPSLEAFIEKRRAVERSGLRCGVAQVVDWPPYRNRIPEWGRQCAEAGIAFGVTPFWGEFEGRQYPDAPQPSERWKGKLCRAGKDYCYVTYTGEVRACVMPSRRLGNLLTGEGVALLKIPAPCESETCSCPDLWRLQEGGGP